MAQPTSLDSAGSLGTFAFDNTYTRAADTTNVFPAQQVGGSPAALMPGIPTTVSIDDNNGFDSATTTAAQRQPVINAVELPLSMQSTCR